MRRLWVFAALVIAVLSAPVALAQNEAYVPALGDIMSAIQDRHIKLWFAGKLQNWGLANYELRRIKSGLEQAATLYRGIPVEHVAATVEPIQAIDAAIEAKDSARFAKGFNALTVACNGCHTGIGRGFIVIQTPTGSPFTDQSFAPPRAPRE